MLFCSNILYNIMKKKHVWIFSIVLTFICSIYLLLSMSSAKLAGFYDVRYSVEYSPDSTFHYVSARHDFYDRVRDRYFLKPEQVQCDYWIVKGPGLFGSSSQRFARIKAVVNDSTFYLTKPIEFSGCILTVPKFDFTKSKKKNTFTYNQ